MDRSFAAVAAIAGTAIAAIVAQKLLQRAPPPPSPHEQASFRQLLLRHLLARSRVDGSLAPVAFEEPVAESTL